MGFLLLLLPSLLLLTACSLAEFVAGTGVWAVTAPVDVVSRAPAAQLLAGGGGSMPIHGNWCGPGYPKPGENPEPIDSADAACMRHDHCYEEKGYFDCSCDQRLVEEIVGGRDYASLNPSGIEWKIINYFAASSCRGGCKATTLGGNERRVCGGPHPTVEKSPDAIRVRVRNDWGTGGTFGLVRGSDLNVFGRTMSWGGNPCVTLRYCCLWVIVEVPESYDLRDQRAVIGVVERAKAYALSECPRLGDTSIGVRVYRSPFDPKRLEDSWLVRARFSGVSGNHRLSELTVRSR